jgi:hypothetical protein
VGAISMRPTSLSCRRWIGTFGRSCALALVQPHAVGLYIEAVIHARSIVSLRDSAVIITPSLDPAWSKTLPQLSGGSRMGGVEAVLLDPISFGGSNGAEAFRTMLLEQGVPTHIVRRQDIRPATGAYGAIRRWEFKTLGTGRVAVLQTPRVAEPPESSSTAQRAHASAKRSDTCTAMSAAQVR